MATGMKGVDLSRPENNGAPVRGSHGLGKTNGVNGTNGVAAH